MRDVGLIPFPLSEKPLWKTAPPGNEASPAVWRWGASGQFGEPNDFISLMGGWRIER